MPEGNGMANQFGSGELWMVSKCTFLSIPGQVSGVGCNDIDPQVEEVSASRSLTNTLPYAATNSAMNVFKDPNVSNIHNHRLHVSGELPSDEVTRFFEGQCGGDFVYEIPAAHMGGTYWYHAHHHGSTYLQVSGGASGQMIIEDSNDRVPANVAAMTERQLLVAYLDPSVKGTGGDTLLSGTLAST